MDSLPRGDLRGVSVVESIFGSNHPHKPPVVPLVQGGRSLADRSISSQLQALGSRSGERAIYGGEIMPVYEYQCQGCKHQFTVVLSITEHDKLKVECPKCKSKKVEQRLSAFYAKTAKKS
jgi:putative FmdB family regulatory protein